MQPEPWSCCLQMVVDGNRLRSRGVLVLVLFWLFSVHVADGEHGCRLAGGCLQGDWIADLSAAVGQRDRGGEHISVRSRVIRG